MKMAWLYMVCMCSSEYVMCVCVCNVVKVRPVK